MPNVSLDEADVALPAVNVTAPPTCDPPVGHPAAVACAGLQSQKLTVPVGTPTLPVSVAVSLTAVPGTTPPPCGLDCVEIVATPISTVKHSLEAFV